MIKKFIKNFIPPIFFLIKNKLISKPSEFEGFYEKFSEIKISDNIWESNEWKINQIRKINAYNNIHKLYNRNLIVNFSSIGSNLGSFVSSVNLISINKKSVKVLDFGGGTGLSYFANVYNMINPDKIEWTVVDSPLLAEIGVNEIKSDFKKISYSANYENLSCDVLLISSVLHYIEDYKKVISELLNSKPSVVHFERLHAGEIPHDYICIQRNNNFKTPIINIKLSNILDIMNKNNYVLVYKANNESEIYDDNSYSKEIAKNFRIKFSLTLTFNRLD